MMQRDETESGFRGGQGRTAADVEEQALVIWWLVVAWGVVFGAWGIWEGLCLLIQWTGVGA